MNNRAIIAVVLSVAALLSGCSEYSSQSLYPREIESVYVEMFDNATFRRGQEYDLTDAIAKRIESDTPYKIISDKSKADSVISGSIVSIGKGVLSFEGNTGSVLENEARVNASFSWKNLKTGQFFLEGKQASGTASYVEFQKQGFDYGTAVAINRLAERIVESMQLGW